MKDFLDDLRDGNGDAIWVLVFAAVVVAQLAIALGCFFIWTRALGS